MDTNKNNYIYVVLTQSGTKIAKMIKAFTHAPYNHASITTDLELREMFSFCRRYLNLPLPAGFAIEDTQEGLFKVFKTVPCEIYSVKVDSDQLSKYNELIEHFKKETKYYSYNALGLLAHAFGIPLHRKKKFVCSHFVAYILSEIGAAKFEKDLCMIQPDDLRYIEDAELIFKGDLKSIEQKRIPRPVFND